MATTERKEGEFPFYPVKPEHPVLVQRNFMEITEPDTGEQRHVIDYGHGFQDTTDILHWGE